MPSPAGRGSAHGAGVGCVQAGAGDCAGGSRAQSQAVAGLEGEGLAQGGAFCASRDAFRNRRAEMTAAPVLDTHVWIWWMLGDPRLKAAEREALDAFPPENRPVLCDTSLWEVGTLVDLGRVELEDEIDDWLRIAASPAAVRLQAVSPEIVAEMNRLPEGFHRDPADRLIVATARVLRRPLATRDARIRRGRVVSLWKV